MQFTSQTNSALDLSSDIFFTLQRIACIVRTENLIDVTLFFLLNLRRHICACLRSNTENSNIYVVKKNRPTSNILSVAIVHIISIQCNDEYDVAILWKLSE